MSREERAKQFAPFDALKGLSEALERKVRQRERVERSQLSEEAIEQLTAVISTVRKGEKVEAVCYVDGFYVRVVGIVSKIDFVYRFIVIGDGKVSFDDLSMMKKIV